MFLAPWREHKNGRNKSLQNATLFNSFHAQKVPSLCNSNRHEEGTKTATRRPQRILSSSRKVLLGWRTVCEGYFLVDGPVGWKDWIHCSYNINGCVDATFVWNWQRNTGKELARGVSQSFGLLKQTRLTIFLQKLVNSLQMIDAERSQVKDMRNRGYSDRQLQEMGFADASVHSPSVSLGK